eukprot:5372853-Lingulodinium_polyedra.AAC.1
MVGGAPRGPRGAPPTIGHRLVPTCTAAGLTAPGSQAGSGTGPGAGGPGSDPLIEPAPSIGKRILHPSVPAFGSPAPGFRRRRS